MNHSFRKILNHLLFSKIPLFLLLDVPHTRTLCLGLWAAHFLGQDTDTMLSCKLRLGPFHLHTSPQLSVSSNENTWKDFLVGLFNFSPALEMICVNKNVHLVMQHPSLGSMTEGSTEKP